jgi:hypothetical protein
MELTDRWQGFRPSHHPRSVELEDTGKTWSTKYMKTLSGTFEDLLTKALWEVPPGFTKLVNGKFIEGNE